MRNDPKENEVYRHFKGNHYQIVCIATDSETEEKMVVYRALYGEGRVWVRPLSMFMSEVDKSKYPDATQEYRFEKIESMVDPGIMEFLDADTYAERIKILSHLHPRITDAMINTMSMALDLDIKDGDIEDRYYELQKCLELNARYETTRLRG